MNESGVGRAVEGEGALPFGDVIQPKHPVADVVDDARTLLAVTERPVVRAQLLKVGISAERLDRLAEAIAVLSDAERDRLVARNEAREPGVGVLEQRALWLREEMLAACRFHLSDLAPAGSFERITHSDDIAELTCDLRELRHLVSENVSAFDDDLSFDARVIAAEATRLLGALRASSMMTKAARQRSVPALPREARVWRDHAYTRLLGLTTEIRAAGTYAFREDIDQQRLFASACSHPVTATLRTTIRALAG